jgi:hypothetical protein
VYRRRHSEQLRLLGTCYVLLSFRSHVGDIEDIISILGTFVSAESGACVVIVKSISFFDIHRMHSDSGGK